jgi:hypothetical protein
MALTEVADGLLNGQNAPEHVDVVVSVKVLLRDLGETAKAEDASVVDQNV